MILSIFLLTVGLAFAVILTGIFLDDYAVQLVGLSFLFISGSLLLAGSVDYKIGENVSNYYVYGDNYTGYHWDYLNPPPACNPNNLDCVKLFHNKENKIDIYEAFDDSTSKWFGIYLMVLSMLDSSVIFTIIKYDSENRL